MIRNRNASVDVYRSTQLLHGIRALLFLPLLLLIACEDDPSPGPENPCAQTIDMRFVGDWVMCDEEWIDYSSGIRIRADGSGDVLWMDWSTGTMVVSPRSGSSSMQICAREGTMIRTISGEDPDTLSYAFDGDRLEIWKIIPAFPDRYRRIDAGTSIRAAEHITFGAVVNAKPYAVQLVAPLLPASARKESCGNGIDLSIHCMFDPGVEIIVHDYRGPGTYPMGKSPYMSFANLSVTDGSTYHNSSTDSSHTGEIVIGAFDEATGRCTGTFFFDAAGLAEDAGFEYTVRNGHFDIPIRQ